MKWFPGERNIWSSRMARSGGVITAWGSFASRCSQPVSRAFRDLA
jgi:hypothetical protein